MLDLRLGQDKPSHKGIKVIEQDIVKWGFVQSHTVNFVDCKVKSQVWVHLSDKVDKSLWQSITDNC